MAIKAVVQIVDVLADTGATWRATVHFAPLVDYTDGTQIYVYGIAGDVLSTTLASAVKGAVQTEMENHGVTFGLLDSVKMVPALI